LSVNCVFDGYSSPVDERSQKSSKQLGCAKTDVGGRGAKVRGQRTTSGSAPSGLSPVRREARPHWVLSRANEWRCWRRAAIVYLRMLDGPPALHPPLRHDCQKSAAGRPVALAPGTSLLFLSVLYLCRPNPRLHSAGGLRRWIPGRQVRAP